MLDTGLSEKEFQRLRVIEERIIARMRTDCQNLLSRVFMVSGRTHDRSLLMQHPNTIIITAIGAFLMLLCLTETPVVVLKITRDMQPLLQGTQKMGQGKLDHRIPALVNDEIGSLSTAFNKMADNIQRLVQKDKDSRIQLSQEMAQKERYQEAFRESEKNYVSLLKVHLMQFLSKQKGVSHKFLISTIVWKECSKYCQGLSVRISVLNGNPAKTWDSLKWILPNCTRSLQTFVSIQGMPLKT